MHEYLTNILFHILVKCMKKPVEVVQKVVHWDSKYTSQTVEVVQKTVCGNSKYTSQTVLGGQDTTNMMTYKKT